MVLCVGSDNCHISTWNFPISICGVALAGPEAGSLWLFLRTGRECQDFGHRQGRGRLGMSCAKQILGDILMDTLSVLSLLSGTFRACLTSPLLPGAPRTAHTLAEDQFQASASLCSSPRPVSFLSLWHPAQMAFPSQGCSRSLAVDTVAARGSLSW